MQASLAVLGTLMALAVWNKGASDTWLVAGLLLGAVVPFTFLVMWPTNKQLNDARLYSSDEVARGLLRRWGWLHSVRAALSVAALVLMCSTPDRRPKAKPPPERGGGCRFQASSAIRAPSAPPRRSTPRRRRGSRR
jgi:hypothetical protein